MLTDERCRQGPRERRIGEFHKRSRCAHGRAVGQFYLVPVVAYSELSHRDGVCCSVYRHEGQFAFDGSSEDLGLGQLAGEFGDLCPQLVNVDDRRLRTKDASFIGCPVFRSDPCIGHGPSFLHPWDQTEEGGPHEEHADLAIGTRVDEFGGDGAELQRCAASFQITTVDR